MISNGYLYHQSNGKSTYADVEQVGCSGQHRKAMRKCVAPSDERDTCSIPTHLLTEF
jgi:hypothetical protein